MASFENWVPELMLAAPAAPMPLIHQCINRAARTFARQTRAWQEWLEPSDITGAALQEYSFDFPQGGELLRLERATIDGKPLPIANGRDMEADPLQHARKGCAYLVSTDLKNFTIGVRGGPGAVQVYVSLIPSTRSTTVPNSIATLYHEAIREGAKAELLNTPGTSYYLPDQAGVSLLFFNRAIDEATAEVWHSNTSHLSRGRTSWL